MRKKLSKKGLLVAGFTAACMTLTGAGAMALTINADANATVNISGDVEDLLDELDLPVGYLLFLASQAPGFVLDTAGDAVEDIVDALDELSVEDITATASLTVTLTAMLEDLVVDGVLDIDVMADLDALLTAVGITVDELLDLAEALGIVVVGTVFTVGFLVYQILDELGVDNAVFFLLGLVDDVLDGDAGIDIDLSAMIDIDITATVGELVDALDLVDPGDVLELAFDAAEFVGEVAFGAVGLACAVACPVVFDVIELAVGVLDVEDITVMLGVDIEAMLTAVVGTL